MYLSEIEIVGFKSFAQKTKLKFAQGLSAVVGPNGCGKTNVVDAIRWVLGEKKASTLRSDVMENVIFNGTRDRKPLGMAEVSITFDNSRKVLSSDYNEVVITRRLYRNGDSEYLMNKTHCRLKDILDLFMDTGIGSDSYSVIELKMVDAILSGKVDDRRAMFEEAAGIKKYKVRRKESLKKLDSVKQDMERISDILQEVRKNVNSLSRQAAKTKRYNQYLSELKHYEVELFAREYRNFNELKLKLETMKKEQESSLIKSEIFLLEIEKENLKHKELALKFDIELNLAIEKEKSLLNEISNYKQSIAVNSERLISSDKNKERLLTELKESENNLCLRIKDAEQISLEIESKLSEINEAKENFKSLAFNRDEANKVVKDKEQKLIFLNNEIITLKNKIDSLNNLLNRSKDKKANIERKITQLSEDKFSLTKQLELINFDKNRNDKQLPELSEDLTIAENELKKSIENKAVIENQLEKIRQKLSELKSNLSSRRASLDFLNSLSDNSEAAKHLLNNINWSTSGEKVLLGESIGTDDEYRIAVLSALGEKAHSFLTDNFNSAIAGINSLKNKSKGKSGFIFTDNIPEFDAPPPYPAHEGVVGWLSEIVRVNDNIRHLLRGLLRTTLLVDKIETAKYIIENQLADACVTIDGTLINKFAYIFGGSVSQKEGQWVGKKERINNLNIEINEIISQINQNEENLKILNSELSLINIRELQIQISNLESKINQNRKFSSQLELKIESVNNSININEENSLRLQNELDEIQIDDSNFIEQIISLNDEITLKNKVQFELNSDLQNSRTFYHEKSEICRNAELTIVSIESIVKSLNNDKIRIQTEISKLENKIKSQKTEFDDLDETKELLKYELEEISEKLNSAETSLNETRNKRDFLKSSKNDNSEKYELSLADFNKNRKEYDKLKESIHHIELQEAENNSNIQNIIERALEQYQLEIESVTFNDNPDFDIKSYKNEISELKEKLSQLGNVNFMALEEYEIQNERLEFYENQMNDLSESEKLLKETIEEINSTAEKNFQETFNTIRDNFKMLFKKLFGNDGESDLELESSDLLESDIVITAKPPNKRPHSIEMLSGGEKTLTAIALLFAIYLVKPSPFCILDEVDAPLDDANIDKFVNLIKDFSLDTQFLIVTHNKKTMESANTLYGVTMQEDGVSKVVAVRLDNDAA